MTTKRLFIVFLFFIGLSHFSFSQGEGNIWYFGDHAGLDFNSSPVQALTNGQLLTQEGVATISSSSGELLFYTDGVTVYNANHQTMLNGTGLNGHYSATQSAVIVPNPVDTTIYYIFTVDELAHSNGLCYSEVNMTLDGGLGAVTSNKNIQLATPVCEKITAVVHDNATDFWVIVHGWNSNSFYSYLVTGGGVNSTAIVSNSGSIHSGGTSNLNSVGYMKTSPTGDRIVVTNRANSSVDLFDFDRVTGQVQQNPIEIPASGIPIYGVEFSPNSEYLFMGKSTTVQRYSLNVLPAQIASTGFELINSVTLGSANGVRALQVAPDGHIYVSIRDYGYIAHIENPNLGPDTMNIQAVYLDGASCNFGLPTFIQSYFETAHIEGEGRCQNAVVQFELLDGEGVLSQVWDFDDPGSGADNNSTLAQPTHIYSQPGNYMVYAVLSYAYFSDTVFFDLTIFPAPFVDLGNDTVLSPGDSIQLSTGPQTGTILWSTGNNSENLTVTQPGVYSVTVVNEYECEVIDEISIQLLGVEQVESSTIEVFPNPATDHLIITNSTSSVLQYKIFDMSGNEVLQDKIFKAKTTIDISSLKIGNYIIQFANGEVSYSLKFLKL